MNHEAGFGLALLGRPVTASGRAKSRSPGQCEHIQIKIARRRAPHLASFGWTGHRNPKGYDGQGKPHGPAILQFGA